MFDDSIRVLIKPREAFAEFKTKASKLEALKNIVLYSSVVGLIAGLVLVFFTLIIPLRLPYSDNLNTDSWGIVIAIPIAFTLIALFVSVVFSLLIVKFSMGKAKFTTLFYLQTKLLLPVFFLIFFWMLLGLIPVIGAVIQFIPILYLIYLLAILVSEAIEQSIGQIVFIVICLTLMLLLIDPVEKMLGRQIGKFEVIIIVVLLVLVLAVIYFLIKHFWLCHTNPEYKQKHPDVTHELIFFLIKGDKL